MHNVIIAGTINSANAIPKGMELLLQGKSALDAVEETIKIVEDNPNDWSVGSGGLPNLLGEVELDASIMDGKTLKTGAVAGLKKYKNPISIARQVMEQTPHALLVGEGADQFASVLCFEETELLSENASDIHQDFLSGKGLVKKPYDAEETMKKKGRYFKSFQKLVQEKKMMEWYTKYAKENHGTVNIIAKDMNGDICCGVSTSGLSFKLPGRTGDSPIIGAGNYADNRYGAAACVGVGEIAIRLSLARIAVYEMSKGKTAEEAAILAIETIKDLGKDAGSLAILVMDKEGHTVSAANFEFSIFHQERMHFWIADSLNPIPTKRECLYVDTTTEKEGEGYHR